MKTRITLPTSKYPDDGQFFVHLMVQVNKYYLLQPQHQISKQLTNILLKKSLIMFCLGFYTFISKHRHPVHILKFSILCAPCRICLPLDLAGWFSGGFLLILWVKTPVTSVPSSTFTILLLWENLTCFLAVEHYRTISGFSWFWLVCLLQAHREVTAWAVGRIGFSHWRFKLAPPFLPSSGWMTMGLLKQIHTRSFLLG